MLSPSTMLRIPAANKQIFTYMQDSSMKNGNERKVALTTSLGTSVSSLVSFSSISAAESQSILSLFAATSGSIPVSVALAYNDFRFPFFVASTFLIHNSDMTKKERVLFHIFLGNIYIMS